MDSSKRTTRIAIQVVMIVRVPAEMDCCAAKNKELGGYPRLSERAVSTVSTNRIIPLGTKSISRSSHSGNDVSSLRPRIRIERLCITVRCKGGN